MLNIEHVLNEVRQYHNSVEVKDRQIIFTDVAAQPLPLHLTTDGVEAVYVTGRSGRLYSVAAFQRFYVACRRNEGPWAVKEYISFEARGRDHAADIEASLRSEV